jgi:hypothetical protein
MDLVVPPTPRSLQQVTSTVSTAGAGVPSEEDSGA